jgi:hypothetical protein
MYNEIRIIDFNLCTGLYFWNGLKVTMLETSMKIKENMPVEQRTVCMAQ